MPKLMKALKLSEKEVRQCLDFIEDYTRLEVKLDKPEEDVIRLADVYTLFILFKGCKLRV